MKAEQLNLEGFAKPAPPVTDEPRRKRPFVFQGTLVDGPQLDLVKVSGLKLTPAQESQLWNGITPRGLLQACETVWEEADKYDDAAGPGRSDVYYTYEASNRRELAAELRRAIARQLGLLALPRTPPASK